MYHIAICDDDINYIYYIEKMLYQAGIEKSNCNFYRFTSAKNFIQKMNEMTAIDLLILDIQIPDMDGNQIAQIFREHFPVSVLVFCSGVYLPTVQSFEPNPFRYLLKEYTDSKMISELKTIIHEMEIKKIEPYILSS